MTRSSTTQWNPKYLAGCVKHAIKLLHPTGLAGELLLEAAKHLECTEKHDCHFHRSQLAQKVNKLRRVRPIQPWEYWLLSAANQILQPVPGVKHSAIPMLRTAIDEYNGELGSEWQTWLEQHAIKEPAYV